MTALREIQRKFGRLKVVTGAIQDEITAELINSINDIQRESGAAEALKVAELFNKAISLYTAGVPMATALLAVTELNKEKKSPAKLLGFAAICLASVLPYVLINQEEFDDYLEELRADAHSESKKRSTRTAKVTKLRTGISRLKTRKK